jgi:hypothetical protein
MRMEKLGGSRSWSKPKGAWRRVRYGCERNEITQNSTAGVRRVSRLGIFKCSFRNDPKLGQQEVRLLS